ncbi:hypothetical protein F8568_043070 [Actinomadura sp. LD22]|uniref:Uncharacterized protein n=1 Tax=Actinomadura physcomitrii TaxID=2650748 RepID=A0A6I4MUM1_9ACTN|nr:hypothetical protein [Actinomadura physcomitrii]MWA07011.1 hypothetical protein [Actinomadura physcomitrii]
MDQEAQRGQHRSRTAVVRQEHRQALVLGVRHCFAQSHPTRDDRELLKDHLRQLRLDARFDPHQLPSTQAAGRGARSRRLENGGAVRPHHSDGRPHQLAQPAEQLGQAELEPDAAPKETHHVVDMDRARDRRRQQARISAQAIRMS